MIPIKRCPVCGDYDIDWCVPCGVAAVEENMQEETIIDETEYYLWMDEQMEHQRKQDQQGDSE